MFVRDPSAEDWVRVHRYASWIRGLNLDAEDNYVSDILSRFSSNSPGGLLFPKLESLEWDTEEVESLSLLPPLLFPPFATRHPIRLYIPHSGAPVGASPPDHLTFGDLP